MLAEEAFYLFLLFIFNFNVMWQASVLWRYKCAAAAAIISLHGIQSVDVIE